MSILRYALKSSILRLTKQNIPVLFTVKTVAGLPVLPLRYTHSNSEVLSSSSRAVFDSKLDWKVGKINHVAIATNDIDKLSTFYRDVIGAKVTEPCPQEDHGVYTVFVELGETKIELISPFGGDSPLAGFLSKNKNGGIHHICLEVNDIESAISDLKSRGIRLLSDSAKIGAHSKPVIFLHPKDCGGVLLELEQA